MKAPGTANSTTLPAAQHVAGAHAGRTFRAHGADFDVRNLVANLDRHGLARYRAWSLTTSTGIK